MSGALLHGRVVRSSVLAALAMLVQSAVAQAPVGSPPIIPGLRPVPAALQPKNLNGTPQTSQDTMQQPGCSVPVITRPDFSASQVAYLVAELQQTLTTGCYSVVSTSLATCLPDFSLQSGCCTSGCGRALRLAVSPECLGQLWDYLCSNGTYYAPYIAAVVKRCLSSDLPLPEELSCPVNNTVLTQLLKLGNPGVQGSTAAVATPGNGSVIGGAAVDQRDMLYYAECAQQPPRLWPDFNGSILFDSLLAFSLDVPQECLRTALAYLPSCYDDLTYESGCCSLRCRAAVEKVPISCFITFQKTLCTRIPTLTKYFFNAGIRCANISLTCQGFNNPAALLDGSGDPSTVGAKALPVVASQGGQCPLSEVSWPGYNAVAVTSQTLKLLADAAEPCRAQIAKINTSCQPELSVQLGCCSQQCALTMRSVPENCHTEFKQLLCRQPEVAKYTVALADRCLGSGYYQCTG